MSEEINSVIDKLCEKLGTTAQCLIPEMAKLGIAEAIVGIIFSALILMVMIHLFPKSLKRDDREYSVWSVILTVIIVADVVMLWCSVLDLAGWITSPTAKAIKEIINTVTLMRSA